MNLFFDDVRLPWYVAVDAASAALGVMLCGLVPLVPCEVPMYFVCAAALLQFVVAVIGNVVRTLLTSGFIVSIQLCTFVSFVSLIVLRHRGNTVPQWVSVFGSAQTSIQYTKSLLDIVVLAQYILDGVGVHLVQKRRARPEQSTERGAPPPQPPAAPCDGSVEVPPHCGYYASIVDSSE